MDDSPDAATSLGLLLCITGHEVRTADAGQAALAVAEAFRPDVVLCDIGLPILNGYQVARRLRQEPWGRETILIATTGWGQEKDRQSSREAGFDYHLVKPVDPAALLALLASLKQTTALAAG